MESFVISDYCVVGLYPLLSYLIFEIVFQIIHGICLKNLPHLDLSVMEVLLNFLFVGELSTIPTIMVLTAQNYKHTVTPNYAYMI